MKERLKYLFSNAGTVWSKYPFTLSCALLATISVILAFEFNVYSYRSEFSLKFDYLIKFPFAKLGLIFMLGISLFFTLALIRRATSLIWLPGVGIVLLAVYYLLLPDDMDSWTSNHITLYFTIALLHHLAVSFLPSIVLKSDELDFWSYNKSLFTNVGQTILFVGVLTVGLLLAIAAIENLFGLHIPSARPYAYISFFSAIFGSSFVFLLFGLNGYKSLVSDREVPAVQKFFVQYILIPLLLVYAAILYAYGLKILIEWSLPIGWVSYMIIAYSALGLISLLLIFPLSKETDKVWVRWFDRIFYFSLLPLLLLLFAAILTRLMEYGFTPNRYFILAIAIWLSGISLYFVARKNANIKVIPISLFTIAFLSIATPYFNAFSVSVRSQKSHFVKLLQSHNLLKDNKINFEAPIKSADANQISSVAAFLALNKQNAFLNQYLTDTLVDSIFKNNQNYPSNWEFMQLFSNLNDVAPRSDLLSYNVISSQHITPNFTDVNQADFIYFSEEFGRNQTIALEKNFLHISQNNWDHYNPKTFLFTLKTEQGITIDEYDVVNYLNTLYEKTKKVIGDQSSTYIDNFSHQFSLGNYDFTLQFKEIQFSEADENSSHQKSGGISLHNVYFYPKYVVLAKRKKESNN